MYSTEYNNYIRHSRRLEVIDDLLYKYACSKGLEFARNLAHEPDRVLRQEGNPTLVMSVQLSEHWTKIPDVEKSRYDFLLAAYYQTPEGDMFVKRTLLVQKADLSFIVSNLTSLLSQGLQTLNSWTVALPNNSAVAATSGWTKSAIRKSKVTRTMLCLEDVQQEVIGNCDRIIQQPLHKLCAEIFYGVDPRIWTDTHLEWANLSPTDEQREASVEVAVGSNIGMFYGLRILMPYTSITKITRPPVNQSQTGLPVFSLSLWAEEKKVFEHHKIVIRWTAFDELGIFFCFIPQKISVECVVNPALSVLFDEKKCISGFLLRSFSPADKSVLDQSKVIP